MGIFIADAAASGHWKPLDDLIGTRNVTTANVTQLMEDFLTAGQWHWRRYDIHLHSDIGPLLGDALDLSFKHDLQQYTTTRDGVYGPLSNCDPLYWTQSGARLPYKLHPLRTHNTPRQCPRN